MVHHGPGFLDGPQRALYRTAPSDSLEIAYVALYRKYKNFEVLLRALRILQGKRVPVRLHLTLDLVEDPGGADGHELRAKHRGRAIDNQSR